MEFHPPVQSQSLKTELETLVRTDNKDAFSSFMRIHHQKFSETQLLKLVCLHDSVGCATVLLFDGDYGSSVDALERVLHLAAQYLSCGLTKLFLQHLDDTKVHLQHPPTSPVTEALKALCLHQYVRDWNPKKSIFKLFYILCLPELKEALDIIRLLASRLGQVESICFHCIAEGELVQLTALLMAANDTLLVSAEGGLENTPVMQYIMRELHTESDQEKKRSSSACRSAKSLMLQSPNNRRVNFLAAQDVIGALWKAGDVLEKYRCSTWDKHSTKHRVPYEVAYDLYMKANLLLKPEDVFCDDVECLRAKLSPEHEVWLNEELEKQVRSRSCTSVVPVNYFKEISVVDEYAPLFYDIDGMRGDIVFPYVDDALKQDNKDKFAKSVVKLTSKSTISLACSTMYMHDSVNCAAAVLSGEIDGFNLSLAYSGAGWTPLHQSAKSIAPKLTAFLLENGFSADARSRCFDHDLKEPLPLNVALRLFRYNRLFQAATWGRRKSAINLVIQLCCYSMRDELEIVRLLALATKAVKYEFFNYLMNGDMVEVGALLLVAGKHILPLSLATPEGEGDVSFNNLKDIFDFLFAKKLAWASGYMHKNKLLEIEGTLLLLKIFDKIGDKLDAYLQLNRVTKLTCFETKLEVASLLESAGFNVKEEYLYGYSRTAFDWKVLRIAPPLERNRTFCLHHKSSSLGNMHGLKTFGRNSFHTTCLPTVDPSTTSSMRRLVKVVSYCIPCKRQPFFIVAFKKSLRNFWI